MVYSSSGIGFLRAENVFGYDVLDKSEIKYITIDTHNGDLKRSIINENDILITIAGTLGRTALVRKCDLPLNANQAVSIIRIVNSKLMNLKYIIYLLNAPSTQKNFTKQKKITAIPNLTLEIISNCIIPIAPLSQQNKIVSKIDCLFSQINN